LNTYHINPPFLQSTTDFKTEKNDDAEKDVNGDGGGGFEVRPGVIVMGNDSIVARRVHFWLLLVVALQKL